MVLEGLLESDLETSGSLYVTLSGSPSSGGATWTVTEKPMFGDHCVVTKSFEAMKWVQNNLYTELEKNKFKVLKRPRSKIHKFIRKNKFWCTVAAPGIVFLLFVLGKAAIALFNFAPWWAAIGLTYLGFLMLAVIAHTFYEEVVAKV